MQMPYPHIDDDADRAFTYHYAQPDAYHFCLDSVLFPKFVAEQLSEHPFHEGFRALDVCAGCGIVGLELAHYLRALKRIDFLEIQEAFRPSFLENLSITGQSPEHFRFLCQNFSCLSETEFRDTYDLIVANPPYFFPTEGTLSNNELQNRSRFFLDAPLETLVRGMEGSLKPGGQAFLLVKPGIRHGRSTLEEIPNWIPKTACDIVAEIRGTPVLRLKK